MTTVRKRSAGRPAMGAAAVLALALTAGACAHRGLGGPSAPRTARAPKPGANPGIGVNAYIWRATLDTLAFMPLASADPYGGVVITDWYVNPEKLDERFKVTVYILDTRLRADGLNVNVFKQVKGGDGQWTEASVTPQTSVDFENAILTRARQVRLSNLNGRG